MIANTVNTIKNHDHEMVYVFYVQSNQTRKNYFQDIVTETFYDIKFIYNNANSSLMDASNFKLLAKNMSEYFSPGLIVNVEFGKPVTYLELKNSRISEEKLFDEFWNFRENVWFDLPKDLTKNRHLAMG